MFEPPERAPLLFMSNHNAPSPAEVLRQLRTILSSLDFPAATIEAAHDRTYDDDYFQIDPFLERMQTLMLNDQASLLSSLYDHTPGHGNSQSTRAQTGKPADYDTVRCPTCGQLVDVTKGRYLSHYHHGIARATGQPLRQCAFVLGGGSE